MGASAKVMFLLQTCVFLLSKLPPNPDFCYSFGFSYGFSLGRTESPKIGRSTTPNYWTSKIQGYVEAFKKGYWGGGNIEGTLKTVDLEKILS
jgi:hypothetical protein